MIKLGVYKLYDDIPDPVYSTQKSACFDLTACIKASTKIKMVSPSVDRVVERNVQVDERGVVFFTLHTHERALIPTGIHFDIPDGYSLRAHPRSGVSFKRGLTLINCEGVIDTDYVEQSFVPLINLSSIPQRIYHLERIAQAEIVPINIVSDFIILDSKPETKTDRVGGFGSTGT